MNKKLVGQLSLIVLTLLWGTTFSFIKLTVNAIGFSYYVALRYGLATVVLAFIIFSRGKKKLVEEVKPGLVLGFIYFCGISLQGLGMEYTSASNAAFITGLSVVMVYVIEVTLGKEKLSTKLIAAIAFSMFGLYFLSFNGFTAPNFGDMIVFVGAFFWALQIIAVGEYSKGSNLLHLLLFESFFTTLGAVTLFPFVKKPSLNNIASVSFYLLYLSILCTILANALQLYGQKWVSNVEAAMIYLLEPVIAALFSYIAIGEQLNANQIFGAIAIILAMTLSSV